MAERTVYLEGFLVQLKPLNTLPNFGGWFCFISWQPVLVKLPILCFFGLGGFLSAIQVFSSVRVVPSGSCISAVGPRGFSQEDSPRCLLLSPHTRVNSGHVSVVLPGLVEERHMDF